MKAIISLAVLAAVVSAQSPADLAKEIPACILDCIRSSAQGVGCTAGDFKCECDNQLAITTAAITCVSAKPDDQKCSAADLGKAQEVGSQICAAVSAGGGSTSTGGSAESSSTSSGESQTTGAPATTTSSTTTRPGTTSNTPPTTSTPGAGARQTAMAWVGAAAAVAAMAL